jgi:hypothetical protein
VRGEDEVIWDKEYKYNYLIEVGGKCARRFNYKGVYRK